MNLRLPLVLLINFCLLNTASIAEESVRQSSRLFFEQISQQANSNITASAFYPRSVRLNKDFQRREGTEIGLDQGFEYTIRDYTDPFWFGRGTAAGDYDQDGWQDIIFGSNNGFILYKNIGGRFQKQAYNNAQIQHMMVYAVAFVDLNNDGWLDIFFTTFNNGNYLVLNHSGEFDFNDLVNIPNQNAVLTLSPAFADLDLNNYPDIINGNVALGVITGSWHMDSRRNNSVVFNNNLKFREVNMENSSGETMATMISDINNDDIPDIYFGNDFIVPDKILLGTGKGYNQVTGNQFIPFTPFFSMGADTGDINNDLQLDFLVTGTMYMAPFVGQNDIDGRTPDQYGAFKGGSNSCENIKSVEIKTRCQSIRDSNYIEAMDRKPAYELDRCKKLKTVVEQDICLTQHMWQLITLDTPLQNCDAQYAGDSKLLDVCNILALKKQRIEKRDLYGAIPQDDRNMLYTFDPASKTLKTVTNFQHPGGWTWNSKIVDIDNDRWQDVITADGTIRKNDYGWNVLMKNIDGKNFQQTQFSSGIDSDFGLYSFALIDMDNDGDLDIIGNSAEGPVQVYINHASRNNFSMAVSLVDQLGNHFGIGAKIIVKSKQHQTSLIREIKASGGYLSFDSPIAYFGLGNISTIDEINVHWPDQTESIYTGTFKANHLYRIERLK